MASNVKRCSGFSVRALLGVPGSHDDSSAFMQPLEGERKRYDIVFLPWAFKMLKKINDSTDLPFCMG